MRAILGAAVIVFVAVLMGTAPVTSASATFAFSPPYSGGKNIANKTLQMSNSGCSAASWSTASVRSSLWTGVVRIFGMAHVHGNCPLSSLYRYVDINAGFGGPTFAVSSSAIHNVSVHWLLDFSASANVTQTKSVSGAGASAVAYAIGWIQDLSTNRSVSHSRVAVQFACVNGFASSCPKKQSAEDSPLNLTTSGYLIAGHTYRVVTKIYLDIVAWVGTTGSNTPNARAQFNMLFLGEQGLLSSMTVS